MSDRMPPSPPRPPKFPGSGKPESPNWGVWVMVLLIAGVLAFGFFTPESFGLGPRKENLESFEAQYKAGRVVLNDPKAPVEVVLSENGSEGVIHALVYKKDIQPKVEMKPFVLSYSMSLPDRDKPLLNELSGYRMVESPYRTEAGKNVSIIPEEAQKLSVPEFNRLALEGRIAGGNEGLLLAEDGNQNVLVGQIVTRIWPAATGDASVDKQRFERVEVPFTLEFQGDRVKQLLGPDTKFKRESGSWGGILLNLLPIVLILVILFFMFRAQSGGARGAMSFGKSRARLIAPDKNKVTFKDVAGISEAKEEVWELVEFLRNPEKFRDLGATIPRGVLMVGSPGTGKTLLARAIAGESNASFYSISGSDFVEMFVGVGASRVRDLFDQAKKEAPAIVFIDEIDAVGRARAKAAAMGGNDERENTLNQLLTEMDGFGSNSGVIILAATNRVDVLDKALLRAGRFDRQIHVDLPDLNERKEVFGVHLRPIKIDNSVDVDLLARQTPGFSGADIANVCNEAALIAARHGKKFVGKQDFLDAVDRIVGGLEKKTKITTEAERRSIAIHEAGHASISWLLEYANPLIKVTIVPRGRALGAAWYLPEERQITTKEQMLDEMCATLGGRAAEDLFLGRISTGAMNDLERVTKQAYGMIAYLGMSEKLPNLCYYNNEEYSFNRPYSEKTAELIDEEVKQMVNEQYERAKKILSENQEGHNRLAQLLIDKEVIFAEDVEHIFGKRPWASRSEEISANKTAAELKKAEQEEEQKAIEAEKEVKEEEKHEK